MFGRALKHISLTIKSKIRQEGERKRVEGKESPERKTDWEKERGGMSDFAAVFFLPSLIVPRGVPLWLTRNMPPIKCVTLWDVVDAVPYNNVRMIARALGKRPYKSFHIHPQSGYHNYALRTTH